MDGHFRPALLGRLCRRVDVTSMPLHLHINKQAQKHASASLDPTALLQIYVFIRTNVKEATSILPEVQWLMKKGQGQATG